MLSRRTEQALQRRSVVRTHLAARVSWRRPFHHSPLPPWCRNAPRASWPVAAWHVELLFGGSGRGGEASSH